MNKTTNHGTGGRCCSDPDCGHQLRNHYFEGKRLTADSFKVEQNYSLERRRLLNRAIHGWGVVYGYSLTPAAPAKHCGPGKLFIGPGLALDQCGRELIQGDQPIYLEELALFDEDGKPLDRDKAFSESLRHEDCPDGDVCWLLRVHYAEKGTGLVKLKDSCQCDYDEWDRICETVRYSLQRTCREKCCDAADCELKCECASGPCCDDPPRPKYEPREGGYGTQAEAQVQPANPEAYSENRQDHVEAPRGYQEQTPIQQPRREKDGPHDRDDRPSPHKRGGCRCLCEHATDRNPNPDCCEIVEQCDGVWVDLKNGVPLACVTLVHDECERVKFEVIDDCGPRRLVKNNDLLFDLIRGCDLTQINDIGWKQWHRQSTPIDFQRFAEAFGDVDGDECVTRDFWVKFSRRVRRDTVRRDCFVMTIIFDEPDDTWWETLRVPIVRIEKEDDELIDRARIVVDGAWLHDTVKGAASLFQNRVTRVEIEIRGDFIIDCNGQAVDANPHGLSAVPTGNGTPGGTYLSTFLVGPAPSRPRNYNEDENRIKGVS